MCVCIYGWNETIYVYVIKLFICLRCLLVHILRVWWLVLWLSLIKGLLAYKIVE
jgi:hypothetical protein